MQITAKLLKVIHNNDFATALHGCTIALGLIYLKTHQVAVVEKLFVPQTMHQLDRIPPDLIVLRILSRNLIMWDEITPSKEWIQQTLPAFLRAYESTFREDMITSRQAYEAIVAGCCYSIALRFAGTFNKQAFETILHYYRLFEEFSITGMEDNNNVSRGHICVSNYECSAQVIYGLFGHVAVLDNGGIWKFDCIFDFRSSP